MAGVTGRDIKGFAFAKCGANSWNVAASVTKGLYFESDGGLKHQPVFLEDDAFGQTFRGPAEGGDTQPPDLTLRGQSRYEDYHYILEALCMGSPATVAQSTSATGQTTSWSHVIDLAPSIDGLALTMASDRKLYTMELTSAKVYGLSEAVGTGGIITQTFRVLGGRSTDISSVNINSTVYGATFPALNGRIQRKQGVFRINAQSGGSLTTTDVQTFAETCEFTFERPQDRSFVYNSDAIVEPADNDFPDPTLNVTFARMNTQTANSLERALRSSTAHKGDLTYSGAYINSTDTYKKLIQFPYMELQDFETPAAGAAQVKPRAVWKLKKPSAAPTGMAGIVNPFRITRIMVNSVHAFA